MSRLNTYFKYADDTTLVVPTDVSICDVKVWASVNKLVLNLLKTKEYIVFKRLRALQFYVPPAFEEIEQLHCVKHLLPTVGPTIGSFSATPACPVRDLGVYIDSDLSMRSHVRRTMSVLTYRASHGAGPSYLQPCFTRVEDMPCLLYTSDAADE